MAGSFKKEGTNKYIMMNRKTLAGVGSLVVLGASVLAQGTTTLGGIRDAVKQNPSAWYVVVGKDAKASDVIGAADVIAALQYYTVQRSVQPVDLSAVKVVLQRLVVNETDLLRDSYSGVEVENHTVVVNKTPIYYSVKLNVPKVGVSLNESNKLQVENAKFEVILGFNETIDRLNSTDVKIPILGKDFYITVNDSSCSEIVLRRVPIKEERLSLSQSTEYLGHTISLVDIYETTTSSNKYIAILSVDGEEVEIPVGETKTVKGLEIYVSEAKKSWVNPANTYVKIGIGGGETYKLVKVDGKYNITKGEEKIGEATLSEDKKTLTLTFTKEYLFAGEEFELPIFGGYKIVFEPYALPPAGSTLAEVKYARSFTENEIEYLRYEVAFDDAASGQRVVLPIFYNTTSDEWALGEKEATQIDVHIYYPKRSSESDVVRISYGSPAKYILLKNDTDKVSALLKIEVGKDAAEITDLLVPNKKYVILPGESKSLKLLGDKEVFVKAVVGEGYGIAELEIYNLTSGDKEYTFYAKDGHVITINKANANIKIDNYAISLDTENKAISVDTKGLDVQTLQEGEGYYKIGIKITGDNKVEYLKYPIAVKVTSASFYLATKDTLSPEVKLQDLLHATPKEEEVTPNRSIQIGNETVTIGLSGVPPQIETIKMVGERPLMTERAILDTEVTADMNNLIVIGGPAVNKIAADLLQVAYPTYGDTLKEMGILAEGEGLIKVFTTPKVAVLVMGWDDVDTRRAARVLSVFLAEQGYPELANKGEAKVTGGLQNPQVS
ncbi:hypothetical protein BA065_00405 [Nanoarchaeota archaeon NZ13-N]|nr:MAG: hypothetical protein BA065_00405 [Nanoarchaeota archaeon NZ13-N]